MAETSTALQERLKVLKKEAQPLEPPFSLFTTLPSEPEESTPSPLFPPLTSELLTRTIGWLSGSIVRWGLSSPIGTTWAALELPMLWGPCESC